MSNNNDPVIEFLLNQLRQQLTSNPYKQQCEDLAHEVLSLKNQLRDASALVAELQEDNIRKSEHISHLTGQTSAYHNDALRLQAQVEGLVIRLAELQWELEAQKAIAEGYMDALAEETRGEQSGCRKDDTQECEHDWRTVTFYGEIVAPMYCRKCGKQEAELNDCRRANTVGLRKGFAPGFTKKCLDCGAKLK